MGKTELAPIKKTSVCALWHSQRFFVYSTIIVGNVISLYCVEITPVLAALE